MTGRLALLPAGVHVREFQRHVRALQDAGHDIVFVTTNLPCKVLVEAMDLVDFDRVHVVDAITEVSTMALDHPGTERVTMVRSPTMLEMIALRTERAVRNLTNPYVIVCCLNSLALHNQVDAVEEFSRFLSNRMDVLGVPVDFLLQDGQVQTEILRSRSQQVTQSTVAIALA